MPEEQPPKTDWYTGQPLTYDVDHTDGYILIDPEGRERFVDVSAPDMSGKLNPKLTSLLNSGGVYELQHPQGPDWTVADALTSISWLLGTTDPPRLVTGVRLRRLSPHPPRRPARSRPRPCGVQQPELDHPLRDPRPRTSPSP